MTHSRYLVLFVVVVRSVLLGALGMDGSLLINGALREIGSLNAHGALGCYDSHK